MKKSLLILTAVVVSMGAYAQKVYNFSETAVWGDGSTAIVFEAPATIDGLTINASASGAITIDTNNKSIDNYSFTQRLKLGGAGSVEARNISFAVSEPSQITVYGMASSSSATGRNLIVSDGTSEVYNHEMLGSAIEKHVFDYAGTGTLYFYSSSGGLNFYAIIVAQSTPSGVSVVDDTKVVESVNYFNVLGKKVLPDTKGLVVVKTAYTDGTHSVVKAFRAE